VLADAGARAHAELRGDTVIMGRQETVTGVSLGGKFLLWTIDGEN
jgi:hypothetical protein